MERPTIRITAGAAILLSLGNHAEFRVAFGYSCLELPHST